MSFLIRTIKGFFIGIALIIPGLSGGTLAIYLGIYEQLLHAIGNVFSEFKKSVLFLLPVALGMMLSIVGLARLLGYLINLNSLIVLLFFMGLLAGGIKDIYLKAKPTEEPINVPSYVSFFISFTIIIVLIVFGKINQTTGIDYLDISVGTIILLFFLGMAASMTMIVPGVSGSALLIVLGYYTAIVTNVAGEILNLSQFTYNIQVIIPFALGAGVGIILFSRLIEYALKHHTTQTYFAILGFITASIIAIFFEIKDPSSAVTHDAQTPIYSNLFPFLGDHLLSLLIGIVLFIGGYIITLKLAQIESQKQL